MDHTHSTPALTLQFRAPGSKPIGTLRYAIGRSSEGKTLVGRTSRGVCAIFLGDEDDALRDQLAQAFPGVTMEEDTPALKADLARVVALIDGRAQEAIDLDVGGTSFQQRVWQALLDIPPGETRSYTELARHIDASHAVRAVAGACAANVLAVAIPCHRVLRSNGAVSGYRWGVERKRALLEREREWKEQRG